MLVNYHMMCYTWFIPDPLFQYGIGYSQQYLIIITVALNIGKMAWAMYYKYLENKRL